MSEKIKELRNKIETVDNVIFEALSKRKQLVLEINQIKEQSGKTIFDKLQEELLNRKYKSYLKDQYLKEVFLTIKHLGKQDLRIKKIGLIGFNIGFSFSPRLHKMIASFCNLNYQFDLIDVNSNNLNPQEFTSKLKLYEYNAFFITTPYKGIFYDKCDLLTITASKVQNVNLIYYDGKNIIGDNTDVFGFSYTLLKYKDDYQNYQPYILGSGMASKSVREALVNNGFKEPVIVSLDPSDKHQIDYLMFQELIPTLVINATPVGGYNLINQSLLDNIDTSKLEMVFDLNYNPLITKTMTKAKRAVNGLYMLVVQALLGIEKIFNKKILTDELVNKLINKLQE